MRRYSINPGSPASREAVFFLLLTDKFYIFLLFCYTDNRRFTSDV